MDTKINSEAIEPQKKNRVGRPCSKSKKTSDLRCRVTDDLIERVKAIPGRKTLSSFVYEAVECHLQKLESINYEKSLSKCHRSVIEQISNKPLNELQLRCIHYILNTKDKDHLLNQFRKELGRDMW